MSQRPRVLAVWLLLFTAACGAPRPKAYEVTGTVTWNGELVPEGDIIFQPEEATMIEDHGKIKAGRFSFRAKAGKKRVQIYASREGKIDPVMKAPVREQYIPERFNTNTKLTAEVKPEGPNQFPFVLD
jgi:hypothetical protein